jgi:hypothetical protein
MAPSRDSVRRLANFAHVVLIVLRHAAPLNESVSRVSARAMIRSTMAMAFAGESAAV